MTDTPRPATDEVKPVIDDPCVDNVEFTTVNDDPTVELNVVKSDINAAIDTPCVLCVDVKDVIDDACVDCVDVSAVTDTPCADINEANVVCDAAAIALSAGV